MLVSVLDRVIHIINKEEITPTFLIENVWVSTYKHTNYIKLYYFLKVISYQCLINGSEMQ